MKDFLKGDTVMSEEDNEQHFGKIRGIVDKIFKKEELDTEEELLNIVQEAEEEGADISEVAKKILEG